MMGIKMFIRKFKRLEADVYNLKYPNVYKPFEIYKGRYYIRDENGFAIPFDIEYQVLSTKMTYYKEVGWNRKYEVIRDNGSFKEIRTISQEELNFQVELYNEEKNKS